MEAYKDKNGIGGYFPDDNSKWPCGSLFASEGERLYDLVRKHKPKKIIEVGTRYGCSTTHLAKACKDNGFGKVHTYDIEQVLKEFPKDLLPFVEFNIQNYFDVEDKTCDMLYEDGAHTTGFTSAVLSETKAKVVAVHDFNHWDCVKTVREEAIGVLGQPDEVFNHEESDCGLAIWNDTAKKKTVKRCNNCNK